MATCHGCDSSEVLFITTPQEMIGCVAEMFEEIGFVLTVVTLKYSEAGVVYAGLSTCISQTTTQQRYTLPLPPILCKHVLLNDCIQPWLTFTLTHPCPSPQGGPFDPHTSFICISQSIHTNVLAENSLAAACQYRHVARAKHPSGGLTGF